jgi:hypothetical protein
MIMYKIVINIYVNNRDLCVYMENVYSNTSSMKQALCFLSCSYLHILEISSNSASPLHRERIDIEIMKPGHKMFTLARRRLGLETNKLLTLPQSNEWPKNKEITDLGAKKYCNWPWHKERIDLDIKN